MNVSKKTYRLHPTRKKKDVPDPSDVLLTRWQKTWRHILENISCHSHSQKKPKKAHILSWLTIVTVIKCEMAGLYTSLARVPTKSVKFWTDCHQATWCQGKSKVADNTETGCFKKTYRENPSVSRGIEIWVCTCLGSKRRVWRHVWDERVQPTALVLTSLLLAT